MEPVADGNGTDILAGRIRPHPVQCKAGGRYSHRVGAPATVALLSDDRCAEMLWVGEREPVQCLRRTQPTQPQHENAKGKIVASKPTALH